MLNHIQQYFDIISSWQVLLHEQDGEYARLKLEIDFHYGSKLYVKDYQYSANAPVGLANPTEESGFANPD